MASFTDIVDDVITITNRPDLTDKIKLQVRKATLKLHTVDYFPKDLVETGIQWNPVAYMQSFDYRTFDPLWRNFKYLRKFSPAIASAPNGTPGKFFELILPEQVLDDYEENRTEVLYLAGANYEIKSSTQDQFMLLGYYRFPNTTELAYNSWIALDFPWAIVYEAAVQIFKSTGYDEQAVLYTQMALEERMILTNNSILGRGE